MSKWFHIDLIPSLLVCMVPDVETTPNTVIYFTARVITEHPNAVRKGKDRNTVYTKSQGYD